MLNYQTWLETPDTVRVALVQVQGLVSGTKYISTHGATVDGNYYLPIIKGAVTLEESLSISYAASISYGDIELINANGEYDSWLEEIWENKTIQVYVGPLIVGSSTLSEYELVFSGLIEDIDSKSRNQLNLKIRDKLEKANTSVSEVLLGNYYHDQILPDDSLTYQNQYKNTLKPLVFGEVHNITPLLTDPSMLEYMVCLEAVELIIEVRDNGVPVRFTTVNVQPGSFRLLATPVGTVTCSIQGIKRTVAPATSTSTTVYNASASNTIMTILKFYGQTLEYTELDAASFDTLGSYPVGVYLNSRVNVLQVCQDIAKSCGLVLTTTRTGVVKLVDLSIPAAASISITDSDILLNSLSIAQRADVIAGVKLGYAKNWTVQSNLTTAIPQQHKDLYATEWLESSQIDTAVRDSYKVTTEPSLENTYLINKTDADVVGLKKLNLFKTKRKIMTMTCTAKFLSVQVGDAATLTSSRFNLSTGILGRVISTKPNWLRGTIEIGILL